MDFLLRHGLTVGHGAGCEHIYIYIHIHIKGPSFSFLIPLKPLNPKLPKPASYLQGGGLRVQAFLEFSEYFKFFVFVFC